MEQDVSFVAAVVAGLLSFLSPCVLPLVPPYLTFIAGTTIEELAGEGEARARRDVTLAAVLFVAGFASVFITLGATASYLGQFIRAHLAFLSLGAGVAIMAMGLHFLGVFRLAFLYREARLEVQKPMGLWGAYVMGLAFAFGWTPCIGPILAAILTVAGSEQQVGHGAVLLAAYSFGLGLPFIAAALAIEPFFRFIRGFRQHFVMIERIVGVLLVVTGLAFTTGAMQNISFWLLDLFPQLGRLG
jgi:cytochrome c-type biogenesis protein